MLIRGKTSNLERPTLGNSRAGSRKPRRTCSKRKCGYGCTRIGICRTPFTVCDSASTSTNHSVLPKASNGIIALLSAMNSTSTNTITTQLDQTPTKRNTMPVSSTANNATASPCEQSASCCLLSLPAELRNRICEFTFATDDSTAATNLLAVAPPPFQLVCTCHQIYNEAISIYERADRDYWTTTSFFVAAMDQRKAFDLVPTFNDRKLQLIANIKIGGLGNHQEYAIVRDDGRWTGSFNGIAMRHVKVFAEGTHVAGYAPFHPYHLKRKERSWHVLTVMESDYEKAERAKRLVSRTCLTKHELTGALWSADDAFYRG